MKLHHLLITGAIFAAAGIITLGSLLTGPNRTFTPSSYTTCAEPVSMTYHTGQACMHCGSPFHRSEDCLSLSLRRGAIGRWIIPDVQIDVAVFASNQQTVVDETDSAGWFSYGQNTLIADHWNQGFNAIKQCTPGMTAELQQETQTVSYICTRVDTGFNTGTGILDNQGNDLIDYTEKNYVICYTCNDQKGNITFVMFKPL